MEQLRVSQGAAVAVGPVRKNGFINRLPVRYASWLSSHNVPFLICSIGMILMLLWAGAFKMTKPGADGIVSLVENSPLIAWQFKVFGRYHGADLIGPTEWTAALLLLSGYFWPTAGVIGGAIATIMFLTTSSMLLTTPGAITFVHGAPFMSLIGLFLYKDILSLGVSLYLSTCFGRKSRNADEAI